jgi:hypothetical protein
MRERSETGNFGFHMELSTKNTLMIKLENKMNSYSCEILSALWL